MEILDVKVIFGYGFYLEIFDWVGVKDVDMLIFVMFVDEVNMVVV